MDNVKFTIEQTPTRFVKKYENGYFEAYGKRVIYDLGFTYQIGNTAIWYAQFVNAGFGIKSKSIISINCSINNTGIIWVGNVSLYTDDSLKGYVLQYGKETRKTDLYYYVTGTWK